MGTIKRVEKVYYDSPQDRRQVHSYHGERVPHKKRKRRLRPIILIIVVLAIVIGGIMALVKKPYTIAIDPGHGGQDVGAIGIVQEVSVTENTASQLEKIFKKDGRFRVVMTRENGEGKTLKERHQKMVLAKPDVSISVHANSDESGNGSGFECYPTPPGRENHEKSLVLAQALVQRMQEIGYPIRGDNGVKYAYYSSDANGNDVKTIRESTDDKVYEQGSFAMVENFSFASILAEQCFITNQNDVANFASDEGCKQAAKAYYYAVCDYLKIKPKG